MLSANRDRGTEMVNEGGSHTGLNISSIKGSISYVTSFFIPLLICICR